MLTWNVTYHCKPGKREEFFKAISDLGVRACSIHETGNLKYDYFLDAQDPDALLLVETWQTPDGPAAPLRDGDLRQAASLENRVLRYRYHRQV